MRRYLLAFCAVAALVLLVGVSVGPGAVLTGLFSSSPSSRPTPSAQCDSDRGQDRSDGRDQGVQGNGCPPCPKRSGYAAGCDGDNDEDDR